jgi:hypothetical protein
MYDKVKALGKRFADRPTSLSRHMKISCSDSMKKTEGLETFKNALSSIQKKYIKSTKLDSEDNGSDYKGKNDNDDLTTKLTTSISNKNEQ